MKVVASILCFLFSSIALSQQKAEIDTKVVNTIIQYLDKSNLPHQEVKQLIQMLRTAKAIKLEEDKKPETAPKE